ncbi:decarboxylating 6-phosphogluconate dehydrogenase [Candidatus Daviesbacteria bacterium]|nr:decarboxylating 6-phosphogluconate dehydrogenase [Candidatus Daviesbacteria bacterium]
MKIGFIGLGRMGSNLVKKLIGDGHEVVAWNRSPEPREKLNEEEPKVAIAESIEELVSKLEKPRVVWTMVLAGKITQLVLDEIKNYMERDDIVVEGSNARYKDSQRRYEEFKRNGVRFLGTGVAGGILGPKEGYAIMAGGDKSAYQHVIPILDTLVKPKASHGYFGEGGAGHFVKMIHNAIEYGYMQSIGEGFDVLEHAPYKLDLLKIAKLWQKSSLVSGFMMDRTVEVLEQDPRLKDVLGVVDATGEAEWAVEQAKEEGITVEIIEASLNYRTRSQQDKKIQDSYTAKMVAALRHAFGAHGVQKK